MKIHFGSKMQLGSGSRQREINQDCVMLNKPFHLRCDTYGASQNSYYRTKDILNTFMPK